MLAAPIWDWRCYASTTLVTKYFYKPLRNYWGLQPEKGTAQEKEDFGPALSPQHLFRSHDDHM